MVGYDDDKNSVTTIFCVLMIINLRIIVRFSSWPNCSLNIFIIIDLMKDKSKIFL